MTLKSHKGKIIAPKDPKTVLAETSKRLLRKVPKRDHWMYCTSRFTFEVNHMTLLNRKGSLPNYWRGIKRIWRRLPEEYRFVKIESTPFRRKIDDRWLPSTTTCILRMYERLLHVTSPEEFPVKRRFFLRNPFRKAIKATTIRCLLDEIYKLIRHVILRDGLITPQLALQDMLPISYKVPSIGTGQNISDLGSLESWPSDEESDNDRNYYDPGPQYYGGFMDDLITLDEAEVPSSDDEFLAMGRRNGWL